MTNHCTPRFFKALSNLEHNYPEVFDTYSKLQLDDVASPLDPDFRIVKDFRDTIRESDWSKYHSDHGLQAEIASCLHRYMGVHDIAEYLGMDAKMIGNVIRDTPELKKIIDKSRRDFSQIIVYDRNNGDYTLARTMYSAARKVGISTASIKFYVNDRHCKYWIHNRYKAKRKVWFDEDNGM